MSWWKQFRKNPWPVNVSLILFSYIEPIKPSFYNRPVLEHLAASWFQKHFRCPTGVGEQNSVVDWTESEVDSGCQWRQQKNTGTRKYKFIIKRGDTQFV